MSTAALLLLDDESSGVGVEVAPAVISNYLWRREAGDTSDGIRVAIVDPDGSFVDWTVASGVTYEYRAEAIGENGTSSFSDWTS